MADDYTILHAENVLSDIWNELPKLDQAVRGAFAYVRSLAPSWIPSWAVDDYLGQYEAWWSIAYTAANDEVFGLAALISDAGEPWVLRAVAKDWSDTVKRKISGLPGSISAGVLLSDDVFSGASANSYRGVIPAQSTALSAIDPQYVDPVSSGLNTLADTIVALASKVEIMLADLVGAIAGLIAAIVGAVAIAPIIAGLIMFVGFLIKPAVDFEVAKDNLKTGTQDVWKTWNDALDDWTGFDGEKWPVAVFAGS